MDEDLQSRLQVGGYFGLLGGAFLWVLFNWARLGVGGYRALAVPYCLFGKTPPYLAPRLTRASPPSHSAVHDVEAYLRVLRRAGG